MANNSRRIQSWHDLDPSTRRWIRIVGSVEASLKATALIDLARRPPEEVRGSKTRWALALIFVNSAGILPVVYFLRGRRS